MIVPIVGNVSYSITLDPTVWIFDERKILLEEAFNKSSKKDASQDELKKLADRFNKEVYQTNARVPRVNEGLTRKEGEEILKNSYVMPLIYFIENTEVKESAKEVTLLGENTEHTIPLEDFKNGYFLFAINGKPLKEDGPVHFYYQDGSNKDNPIKGIKKVKVN